MIKHSESTQSKKFAISLQYLKKKEEWDGGMEFIFCMQIKIKVSRSSHFIELARLVQSTLEFQNLFAMYYAKCVVVAFVFYCDAKHSDILQRSSHLCC